VRIALGVEYDGSQFCGWQTQPQNCSVQDTLAAAVAAIAAHPVDIVAAGRTDAGVHAMRQVVHFDTLATRPATAWVRGVNSHLPPGVSVLWAQEVPPAFHARFSATGRAYQYVLLNDPVRPALLDQKVGWYHVPLDLARMQAGAAFLLGRHDFSAFRAANCQARSPVRTLRSITVRQYGRYVLFDLRADAFLYHMVRNIIGCLVYVGSGRQPPEWMQQLLASGNRALAAPTFAPDGLYLRNVEYDAHWALPGFPESRYPWTLDAVTE
jgi:tRNA pseudouridine38-40 synthase